MKKILLTLLATGFCLYVQAQHGVSPEWTNGEVLPNPNNGTTIRGFLYSNIASFSNGKRVVFLNKTDSPSGIYYTWSYDGISWATPLPFAPVDVVGLNSPKITSDNKDKLHIVWASQSPKALYYTQLDSALNIIKDSVRIASNPDFGSYNGVYITTDLKNRIHIMWHEGNLNTTGDITECYYSRSLDNGANWQPKQLISTSDGKSSAFPRGQYNAYGGDSLAIFWRNFVTETPDDWDIKMVLSTNGGASWSSPTTLNSTTNFQGDPDLVIDPKGRFHLFYHDAPQADPYWGIRVVYGYSDDLGVTWKPSSSFQNNVVSKNQRSYLVEGSRYDVTNNVLWTFWKEEDELGLKGGDMMCTYSTDRGLTWSEPEYITDEGSTSIGFKAVTLLGNGAVAANYELPNFPSSGQIRVVYKERTPVINVLGVPAFSFNRSIYPNPASSQLHITDLNIGATLTLFNNMGKQVLRLQTKGKDASFRVNELVAGVYILQIDDNQGQQRVRVVIGE